MTGLVPTTLGLFLAVAASWAFAQDPPAFGPEVTSVLGEPDGAKVGLDVDILAVLGPPAGAAPDPGAINAISRAIDTKLRCPVCQGVAIADSPASMATNMRAQVRDLVAKGYSEEQILNYFERSYGEFVRLEPPLRGLNWMLWILPAIALAGGAFIVVHLARQKPAPVPSEAETVTSAKPVDPELAKYLERIRRDSGTTL